MRFSVTVSPTELRWCPPLHDEVLALLHELGSEANSATEEFVRMVGNISLRWNRCAAAGVKCQVSANVLPADVERVMSDHGIDYAKALQVSAEAIWQQQYAPLAREKLMRALVEEELHSARREDRELYKSR